VVSSVALGIDKRNNRSSAHGQTGPFRGPVLVLKFCHIVETHYDSGVEPLSVPLRFQDALKVIDLSMLASDDAVKGFSRGFERGLGRRLDGCGLAES
jgi:hypothetical protein